MKGGKDDLSKNRDDIIHFDFLPTILYGLGYSAFGELDQKLSENRVEEINKDIMNFSSSYIKLWQPKK